MGARICILGSGGQLGQCFKLVATQYPEFELHAYGRELDATQSDRVNEVLRGGGFDVVINCAAYNQVDLAETDCQQADRVNHQATRYLAEAAKAFGFFLVHFSTDYVFNGVKRTPYSETDLPNPINIYGQTKLKGEQACLAVNPPGLVIRTSWLFSPYGRNFLTRMLELGKQNSSLKVVADQIGSPTSALDLAKAVFEVLRFRQVRLEKDTNHQAWCSMQLAHFANQGQTSWAELAQAIMNRYELDCQIIPIPSSDYPTAAKRPAYSVLDSCKIQAWLPKSIRHWREGLDKMVVF
jgi:dTDP-4-dehydrorhamnose reductase